MLRILIALGVNAILSRLLNAYDFGVAAIITVFSTFFLTISDAGISPAIVQIKELNKDDTDSIFSLTVYIAVASAIAFFVISYPVSRIYNDSIYISMFLWLSISVLFGVINMVPSGLLNRDKRFILLSIRNIISTVLSATLAIVLAINGFGIYAIVAQSVVSSIVCFFTDYVFTKPTFRFRIQFSGLKKIYKFSVFQYVFYIVCYLSRTIDDLLTGKFISTVELGYYNKAYTVMLYPVDNLAGVFSPVIHPLLSDYQMDHSKIYDIYVKISRLLFLLGGFVSISCFVCSNEIIRIICGENWERTIICFRVMSFAILPQMLNSCVSAVYQSINNTKLLLYNSIVNATFSLIAIFISVFGFKSIYALSISIAIVYYFHNISAHFMLLEFGLKTSVLDYCFKLRKELFVFFISLLLAFFIKFNIPNIFYVFLCKMIVVLGTYVLMIIFTGDYKLIVDFLFKKSS